MIKNESIRYRCFMANRPAESNQVVTFCHGLKLTALLFFMAITGLYAVQEPALMQQDQAVDWFLCDKKNNLLHFEWIMNGDLCEEEQLYLRTFKELYKDVPESYFGPQGLVPFLQKIFAEEKSDLHNRYFVSVKKDGHVIAFASFKKIAQEHEVYLKLIVTDTSCRQCGIGGELILTILKKLPNIQRIVLDTRKKNNGAHDFYKKLGFKECACIDRNLPQEWYTGFVGNINELIVNIGRLRKPIAEEQTELAREILQNTSVQPETKNESDVTKIFLIHAPNEQEGFNALLGALKKLSWYKDNGYSLPPLPSNPLFKDLEEHSEKINNLNWDSYFKVFISEVYQPISCVPIQKMIRNYESTLLTALDRIRTLHQQWGFKISPHYNIILELYGPGGSYNPNCGNIVINVTTQGFPIAQQPLCEIIIHEMVHIGIEDIIVQKFQLTHWEKEALVDTICSLYFNDLLPHYWIQPRGDKKIKEYVTYENICNDLPGAIKQYISRYPREKIA